MTRPVCHCLISGNFLNIDLKLGWRAALGWRKKWREESLKRRGQSFRATWRTSLTGARAGCRVERRTEWCSSTPGRWKFDWVDNLRSQERSDLMWGLLPSALALDIKTGERQEQELTQIETNIQSYLMSLMEAKCFCSASLILGLWQCIVSVSDV